MITIDKGIPLPPKREYRFPFRDMAIGDSFAVSAGVNVQKTRAQLASFCNAFAKRHPGFKFVTRTVDGGSSVRCWRVAPNNDLLEIAAPRIAEVPMTAKVRVHIMEDDSPKRVVHGKRY